MKMFNLNLKETDKVMGIVNNGEVFKITDMALYRISQKT